jgi:hypothetical protein
MSRNTRRLFIICIISLIVFNFSIAQGFSLGIKSGLTTSNMYGDQYIFTHTDPDMEDKLELILDPGVALRYSGGIVMRFGITPLLSLQTEILYSTKGAKFKEEIDVFDTNFRLNGHVMLGYIELPVLFHLSTSLPDQGPLFYPKAGMRYNIYLGGVAAYRTRATFTGVLTGDIFGAPLDDSFKNQVWNQFTDFDYGGVIGVGLEYGTREEGSVFLDIRYVLGLTDIGNNQETNFNLRNTHVTLSMGILF